MKLHLATEYTKYRQIHQTDWGLHSIHTIIFAQASASAYILQALTYTIWPAVTYFMP